MVKSILKVGLFNKLHLADKKNNGIAKMCSIPVNWCQITQNLTEHCQYSVHSQLTTF